MEEWKVELSGVIVSLFQSINQGQMFEFVLKVTGKKPLTVTWFRNETTKVKSSQKSRVTYSSSTGEAKLVVMEADAEDDGEYKIVAHNDLGDATQTCRVTVICKHSHFYFTHRSAHQLSADM